MSEGLLVIGEERGDKPICVVLSSQTPSYLSNFQVFLRHLLHDLDLLLSVLSFLGELGNLGREKGHVSFLAEAGGSRVGAISFAVLTRLLFGVKVYLPPFPLR